MYIIPLFPEPFHQDSREIPLFKRSGIIRTGKVFMAWTSFMYTLPHYISKQAPLFFIQQSRRLNLQTENRQVRG